jgi:hypothetical protein
MRKLWAAVLTVLSALIFLIVACPPAGAFGSEVLGCDAGLGWTANACHDTKSIPAGHLINVSYSPANTSGTYATSWAITGPAGAITQTCQSTFANTPCIYPNSGCTAGSMSCLVTTRADRSGSQVITAALTLSQSGRTRTVTAQATIWDGLY